MKIIVNIYDTIKSALAYTEYSCYFKYSIKNNFKAILWDKFVMRSEKYLISIFCLAKKFKIHLNS